MKKFSLSKLFRAHATPKLCGPSLADDGEKEIWVVPAPSPEHELREAAGQSSLNFLSYITEGKIAHEQGRLDEALELFQKAAALQPRNVEVHNLLGNLLQDLHQQSAAIACYQQAIELEPDYAPAHQNLGVICAANNQPHEALKHYEAAQASQPSPVNLVLGATMLPIMYQSQEQVDYWRERLEKRVAALADSGVKVDTSRSMIPSSFNFAYHGRNDRPVMQNLARIYHGVQSCPAAMGTNWRPQRSRPRIGFLSAHYCNHTIGRLNLGMIELLPKSEFEVSVVALRHHDDDFSRRFKRAAESYVEVPRAPEAARRMIAELDLDILIFSDIGMDALTQTLCYSRMAPIQATTWGHPDTTGSPHIDYFISTALAEPIDADGHYSEQLVRLPTMGVYYYRPQCEGPSRSREYFGLSPGRHLYLCPQTLFKFHPEYDAVIRGILQADPLGELVVIEGRVPVWTKALLARWQQTLEDTLPRVRFIPAVAQPDFLQLLSLGDVMLDPFPFGGGNTTYEALAMGTPVVTSRAQFLRGRLALGMYHRMGMEDLIADSLEHYVETAVWLATDGDYRHAMRQAIVDTRDVLFENSQDVVDVAEMLRRWCS
ncbi:MAG: tetratricopeptide repeat protein [Pirellulaceae bacterium]|nr:tetratricopeptide repeat protein [Pirellulaceae bacterium]